MIWWFISWFVVGFICTVTIWINDMRGQQFDKHYFEAGIVTASVIFIILGYISPIITFYVFTSEKKYFTRFIYWIANIGVKAKNDD